MDRVNLRAPAGRITGLIGPNGAGKTTTFNAVTGLVKPTEGTITINGVDVTSKPPQVRARLGLGRTFQRMELFDSLTVEENVALGAEASLAGNRPWRHLVGRVADRAHVASRVDGALHECGVEDLRRRRPAGLSTGQRRLVELARVMAGPFDVLLLDEPSSGLDHRESERFGEILRSLVEERGVAMLLVEHDMSLVMSVCDHIHVLDFGVPIFDGTRDEVAGSDLVRAAYLGADGTGGESLPQAAI
ncbi:MAG: ATP-binding cassette domain-containing protein [Actinomycetota bacterium]|nr:ATP-binding cassette domain-containing protein [Actinomycetota bacterium]